MINLAINYIKNSTRGFKSFAIFPPLAVNADLSKKKSSKWRKARFLCSRTLNLIMRFGAIKRITIRLFPRKGMIVHRWVKTNKSQKKDAPIAGVPYRSSSFERQLEIKFLTGRFTRRRSNKAVHVKKTSKAQSVVWLHGWKADGDKKDKSGMRSSTSCEWCQQRARLRLKAFVAALMRSEPTVSRDWSGLLCLVLACKMECQLAGDLWQQQLHFQPSSRHASRCHNLSRQSPSILAITSFNRNRTRNYCSMNSKGKALNFHKSRLVLPRFQFLWFWARRNAQRGRRRERNLDIR